MTKVQSALLERNDVSGRYGHISEKMDRCGVDWHGRYQCNSPGCSRCLWRNIEGQKRRLTNMFEEFGDDDNREMAFMTVVLPGTPFTSDLNDILKKGLNDLRNRVRACRRSSTDWWDLAIFGWIEIDAVAADQLQFVAPQRRDLLLNISPFGLDRDGPMWSPVFHAVVYLGRVPIDELRDALKRQWPFEYQTDVQPFWENQSFKTNVENVVGYANKFKCSTNLCAEVSGGRIAVKWPPSWEAELLHWLHAHRNAFERLRFSIKQRQSRSTNSCIADAPELSNEEPFQSEQHFPERNLPDFTCINITMKTTDSQSIVSHLYRASVYQNIILRHDFDTHSAVIIRDWSDVDRATYWCEQRWRDDGLHYRRRIDAEAKMAAFEFPTAHIAASFQNDFG